MRDDDIEHHITTLLVATIYKVFWIYFNRVCKISSRTAICTTVGIRVAQRKSDGPITCLKKCSLHHNLCITRILGTSHRECRVLLLLNRNRCSSRRRRNKTHTDAHTYLFQHWCWQCVVSWKLNAKIAKPLGLARRENWFEHAQGRGSYLVSGARPRCCPAWRHPCLHPR